MGWSWAPRASAPRVRLALAIGLSLGTALVDPARAHAHGRPPALRQLVIDPADPERWVAQATWGLATSDDGGESWRWTCAAAYDVDPTFEDPRLALIGGGIFLASFAGVRSSPRGCEWDLALSADIVSDLVAVSNEEALALVFDGERDRLVRWAGGGAAAEALFEAPDDVLFDRLVVAPGDPATVYLGARVPLGPMRERQLVLLASVDGGETFRRTDVARVGEEYALEVDAVDPDDPQRLFAHALNFDGETAPERVIRSEDGGATVEEVLGVPQVGGLLALPGGVVVVGSRLGGLWVSRDGGDTFARVAEVAVQCLSMAGDALLVCTDQALDGFALARLEGVGDDEVRITPLLRLDEIREARACPTCSASGITCPGWLPDIVQDLGIPPEEVGLTLADLPGEAGTGAPREASLPFECGGPAPPRSAGCASSPGQATSALIALGLLGARSRRRRDATRGD